MTIAISPEHGYVILAASGTFLLNVWQMMKIGGKRKELGIAVSLGGISSTSKLLFELRCLCGFRPSFRPSVRLSEKKLLNGCTYQKMSV